MSNTNRHIQHSIDIISPWLTGLRIWPGPLPAHLKSIVAGKLYDTKTAVQVTSFHHYPNEHYYSLEECLYQNKSGKFFLTGEGMGGTPYGYKQDHNGEYVRGHVLLPLTDEQAKKWLEIRDLVDEFITIFGCPEDAS